ncbi:MAG: hypothetical protein ACYSWO_12995 [Planctomycetota bacterium]|jgi:hypothetical protein
MKKLTFLVIIVLYANASLGKDIAVSRYKDSELRIEFPPVLAGMKFMGVRKYDQPGYGYCVRYQGRRLKADIYIYDGGLNNIPNGCGNELVKGQASSIGQMLKVMQQKGLYGQVKSLDSGVRPQQGPIRFAWNKYQLLQPAGAKDGYTGILHSESFVTGFGGKFVKIRLTYNKENSPEGKKTSELLTGQIVRLLKAAATPAEGEQRCFALRTDGSLPEKRFAFWLGYLVARQAYILKNEDQYDMLFGVIVPGFEEELEARSSLAQIWKEIGDKGEDKYLSDLELVHDAGFMREYVWTYLKRASWNEPENLRMEDFKSWQKANLKEHKAETYGSIKVGIETIEPQATEDAKTARATEL